MSVFKAGDKVRLVRDAPDGNIVLTKGLTGTVLGKTSNNWAVLWDKDSPDARGNDYRIHDFIACEYVPVSHSGRLWFVTSEDIQLAVSYPEFRKKKRGETTLQYEVCKKAYELDQKFKDRNNEKVQSVSVQDDECECETTIIPSPMPPSTSMWRFSSTW